MIRWTGLAPWEFEFPFPGSLTSTFPGSLTSTVPRRARIPGSYTFVSLNSRLESNKEEKKVWVGGLFES